MNGAVVTVAGNTATDVRLDATSSGVPVAEFRLGATERWFDRRRQEWTDGPSSFYTVRAFRGLAENVVSSVSKGDPLLVTGRLRVAERDRGEGRGRYVAVEIDATSIGHDLARGTSVFRRTVRGRPGSGTALGTGTVLGAGEGLGAEAGAEEAARVWGIARSEAGGGLPAGSDAPTAAGGKEEEAGEDRDAVRYEEERDRDLAGSGRQGL